MRDKKRQQKGMREQERKKGRQRWWVHEVKEVCSIYNQQKVKKSTSFSLVNLINLGIQKCFNLVGFCYTIVSQLPLNLDLVSLVLD